jgi:hypothetical protein
MTAEREPIPGKSCANCGRPVYQVLRSVGGQHWFCGMKCALAHEGLLKALDRLWFRRPSSSEAEQWSAIARHALAANPELGHIVSSPAIASAMASDQPETYRTETLRARQVWKWNPQLEPQKGKRMSDVPDEAIIEANRAVEKLDAAVPAAVLRAALEAAAPHIARAEREATRKILDEGLAAALSDAFTARW